MIMKKSSFLFLSLPFLLLSFCGCDLSDLEFEYTGYSSNEAFEDQFNAIQGDRIQGNVLDNDWVFTTHRFEDLNIETVQGFNVRLRPTGDFTYEPPPTYFGRDTFWYTLLTIDKSGEARDPSQRRVYLNIIEKARTGHFADPRDGQQYATILLDDGNVWMAENLNVDLEGSFWYENDPENGALYGRLYTWPVAKEACPEGWHLPSKEEVIAITEPFKIPTNAQFPIRDINYYAHYEGGFTGLDLVTSGMRGESEKFGGLDYEAAVYWTSTLKEDSSKAYELWLDKMSAKIYERDTSNAYPCRCVKNNQ